MIPVIRLDGAEIFINEENIQWIESMPDTAITFVGGARMIVRDQIDVVLARIRDVVTGGSLSSVEGLSLTSRGSNVNRGEEGPRA